MDYEILAKIGSGIAVIAFCLASWTVIWFWIDRRFTGKIALHEDLHIQRINNMAEDLGGKITRVAEDLKTHRIETCKHEMRLLSMDLVTETIQSRFLAPKPPHFSALGECVRCGLKLSATRETPSKAHQALREYFGLEPEKKPKRKKTTTKPRKKK